MATAVRAVLLLVVSSLDAQRQQVALLHHAARRAYLVEGLTFDPAAALALLRDRFAEVILAPFQVDGLDVVADQAAAAGGRLEYVRPPRSHAKPPTDLVVQLHARGADDALIAHLLDVPLGEVRRRLGTTLREEHRQSRALTGPHRRPAAA